MWEKTFGARGEVSPEIEIEQGREMCRAFLVDFAYDNGLFSPTSNESQFLAGLILPGGMLGDVFDKWWTIEPINCSFERYQDVVSALPHKFKERFGINP